MFQTKIPTLKYRLSQIRIYWMDLMKLSRHVSPTEDESDVSCQHTSIQLNTLEVQPMYKCCDCYKVLHTTYTGRCNSIFNGHLILNRSSKQRMRMNLKREITHNLRLTIVIIQSFTEYKHCTRILFFVMNHFKTFCKHPISINCPLLFFQLLSTGILPRMVLPMLLLQHFILTQ